VTRRFAWWLATVGAAFVGIAPIGSSYAQASRTVALPGWAVGGDVAMRPVDESHVLIRRGGPDIAGLGPGPMYLLDTATLTLEDVHPDAWERSATLVTTCDTGASVPGGVVIDATERLAINERPVPIHGRTRRLCADASHRRLAVLSAVGMSLRGLSFLPALGRSDRILGWRYHQTFGLPGGEPLGEPINLGFWRDDPRLCCSPVGPVAVYADARFSSVTLVRLEP
jgi:hypothetical protein